MQIVLFCDKYLRAPKSTVLNNLATGYTSQGGGIHCKNGKATIINSTIIGNISRASGGGLYNYQGTVNMDRVSIMSNQIIDRAGYGAGLHNFGGTLNITNSIIMANRTTGLGGAISRRARESEV